MQRYVPRVGSSGSGQTTSPACQIACFYRAPLSLRANYGYASSSEGESGRVDRARSVTRGSWHDGVLLMFTGTV